MANINIFALGGQDENGKNCFVIEIDESIFVVNAGLKVPIHNKYGVDGIIPDFDYLLKNKKRIKGLFVTHAHDETFAAIPWLLMDMPEVQIFTSEFTQKVIQERASKYNIGLKKILVNQNKGDLVFGKVVVKSFSVANSIPGSLAFNFQTSDGDIIFMSNYALDNLGTFGHTNLAKIKGSSNNVLALMIDSRIANFNGSSADKKSIKSIVETKFKSARDNERIIIGAYDEEMFVIQEVIDLAIKYNRPIASYGRAFDTLYQMMIKIMNVKDAPKFVDYKQINRFNDVVILITGTWSRLFKRFVRIAHGKDVFLRLRESDNIIMIAPPINGMEVVASQALDEVAKIAPNIVDVTDKDYYQLRPAKEDIFTTVQTLEPKYVLPMSALYRYLVVASQQAIRAKVPQSQNIILQNGKIASFKNGTLTSQNKYIEEYGDVIIDGFGAGDISHAVIRERLALAAGGLVLITQQISRRTKKAIDNPSIQLVGVTIKEELKTMQEAVAFVVKQKMEEAEEWNYREIQNAIRKRVRKVMSKLTNKEPLVVTTFYEI